MRIFLIFLFVYLHITSFAQSVLPKVASGKIIRIENFQSKYVTPRNIDVWLPDNYSEGQFYDVLYLHDGQMLFDSANTWNKQEWGVDETMQRLIDENKINATIVVGIWNNGKYRHSEYFPQVFLDDLREDFKKEFLNTWLQNIPQSDNYLKFITDELMHYIEAHFSVNTGKKHTFIGGSSMGGLISMYAVSKYPQKFGGVMGLSTAWIGQRQPNSDIPIAAFNYFQKHMPSPLDLRVYQDHGTKEADQYYNNYQRIIDELFRDFGFKDYNYKSMVFEGSGHNETDWAKHLEIPLEYLLKKRKLQETPKGKIDHIENFKSKYIPGRSIDIWLPADYHPNKKYPVLYAHDGQMLFDATTTWNNQAWNVDDIVTELAEKGAIPEIIVVGIDNGNSNRLQEYLPEKVFNQLTKEEQAFISDKLNEKSRTNNSFKPYSDNYLKFIVEELKPFLDSAYSTKKDKANTAIMGSSAGGIISAYALLEYPQVFGSAICLSTHWIGIFQTENNPFPDQVVAYFDEKLPLIGKRNKIFMDVADTGLDILYHPTQRRIDQLMIKHNVPEKNWKTIYQKDAEHTESSWNKRLPEALIFIFGRERLKTKTMSRNQKRIFFKIISSATAQELPKEKFMPFPFGSIKPTGWLKEQMQKDVNGFVGNLDLIVPELINDPIYGEGRLHKYSKTKDLGNHKEGDAEGDEQYKWWNSETQSNWWDGNLRNVFLLDDKNGIEKAKKYVETILATQDEDGYIGIYDKELRYNFNSENGELWSKASLYRGLLAYYEYTQDENIFKAVERAVENVIQNYPIKASSPFNSGTSFNGGVSHGLTFTDVLERMYFHTKDEKYRQYALFLYQDFSNTYQSEADVQLKNILNPTYKLKSHGVHTFEHIRALIIAKYAGNNEEIDKALKIYLERIKNAITISGGAIGDEWIAERNADAAHTGYEYCSLQELLDSYCLLFQKTGNAEIGDNIENTFYNAAQGSRNPQHSCIAYLKTDNSYEMLGTKNGEIEPDRKQTRYKYSPAHQDVAVCCNPNAGRISPYFVQNSWMNENETTLVAALLMPNILETTINENKIQIENSTEYPYQNDFKFKISQVKSSRFTLKIRKPNWVAKINTNEKFKIQNDFIVIEREFSVNDIVYISFEAEVQIKTDNTGNHYYTYGALLYALPINSLEIAGKNYNANFTDFTYEPVSPVKYLFKEGVKANYKNGKILTKLINQNTGKLEKVELLPIGKTILRQASFM